MWLGRCGYARIVLPVTITFSRENSAGPGEPGPQNSRPRVLEEIREGTDGVNAACSSVDPNVDGSLPGGDAASVLRCGGLKVTFYLSTLKNNIFENMPQLSSFFRCEHENR